MLVKIFGDTTPIDWKALGVGMPFAPMHELAKKYELENPSAPPITLGRGHLVDIQRTFETKKQLTKTEQDKLLTRIRCRTRNTISALEQCSADTICVNIGGGMHHAGKYPNTGYAYSLINDHIWAVDYQLQQNPNMRIGIWDIDFHYPGGTIEYYVDHPQVDVLSESNPLYGVLYKHTHLRATGLGQYALELDDIDKVVLNLGTDYSKEDALFGQYAWYDRQWVLAVWKNTIGYILEYKKPLAITFGGSYGDQGISMYSDLITWLQELETHLNQA